MIRVNLSSFDMVIGICYNFDLFFKIRLSYYLSLNEGHNQGSDTNPHIDS